MNIEIDLHTYQLGLIFDLLGKPSFSLDDEILIADKVKLKFNGIDMQASAISPQIYHLILNIGQDIAIGTVAGLTANWLYDKLKTKKIVKLEIERTEVEFDEGKIKKIIEEKLKMK